MHHKVHCVQSVLQARDGLLLPAEANDAGGGTELDSRTRRKLWMKTEGGGMGKGDFTTGPSGLAVLSFKFGWSNEWLSRM